LQFVALIPPRRIIVWRAVAAPEPTPRPRLKVSRAERLARRSDSRPVLDGLCEYRTGFVEIAAGVEQPIDFSAVFGPLFDLVEIAIIRVERVVGFFIGPIALFAYQGFMHVWRSGGSDIGTGKFFCGGKMGGLQLCEEVGGGVASDQPENGGVDG
jgi:hypothetical protein